VLALLALASLTGCRDDEPVYNTRFLAFGTLMDLSIVGVEHEAAEQASRLLEQDFAFMHQAWHAWDPGPMGRVNRLLATGEPFASPPSILPLLHKSRELAQRSGNLFNPAVGHLVDLWGFHTDSPECRPPPDSRDIEALVRANPSMSDIQIDGLMLRSTNAAVKLDFGAIGKGYGIDLAIGHLRELGIRNAIINAGGDLRAIGDRGGRPWRIAVRSPSGGVLAVLEVAGDESVFTSGDYERNFIYEGRTYHHIIDPRTGRPAGGSRSVTVVHSDATTADAAATALFVAGPEHWHRTADALGIRYVLLIDTDGTVHMNPEMAKRVELLRRDSQVVISPPLGPGPRPEG
jgi:thiamine biosynthesis lipoprotein